MNRFKSFLAGLVLAVPFYAYASEAAHDELIALAQNKEADFTAALTEAKDAGMPGAYQLEAEIVRALSTGDFEGLLGMIDRIDAVGDEFRYGLDRTFNSARQLAGFADTIKAVEAYRNEDFEAFERFAISSYEKSPGYNASFGLGQLLSQQRAAALLEASMADFRVPMDMELASADGETRALANWMGDNKLMLVDFWASWCGPCIRLMPELKKKEAELSSQGVFVAAINTDRNDPLNNAKKVRTAHQMDSVPWLMDRNTGDLSGMLNIDSIPRMVLIDREGKVLYNGHPQDPELVSVLASYDVKL